MVHTSSPLLLPWTARRRVMRYLSLLSWTQSPLRRRWDAMSNLTLDHEADSGPWAVLPESPTFPYVRVCSPGYLLSLCRSSPVLRVISDRGIVSPNDLDLGSFASPTEPPRCLLKRSRGSHYTWEAHLNLQTGLSVNGLMVALSPDRYDLSWSPSLLFACFFQTLSCHS